MLKRLQASGAVETLDADHAQGAVGGYAAMERAIELARQFGIAAVGIRNGSHFGAAGAYSIEAAKQGLIGLSFCNSDSFVRLHDGATRFHGTNPISMAVPIAGEAPWLLDMATSAVPFNRVMLYRSTSTTLPEGVASNDAGIDTTDPQIAEMLAPRRRGLWFQRGGSGGHSRDFQRRADRHAPELRHPADGR
ncbi:Ldh family oxidoreductase (plasmid) [Aliirhizobium terrae]|nr:Ldh family oxidoreductase [Rhizobium sp. CC-CFT758]WJH37838.1 Ldh family oxidoreductase [Rhizobium sp. CC-CFT758]